jgi:hypothetical protein
MTALARRRQRRFGNIQTIPDLLPVLPRQSRDHTLGLPLEQVALDRGLKGAICCETAGCVRPRLRAAPLIERWR